jgi:hypothetical protein
MTTEHFYPDWIEEAFDKKYFIYNPEIKNYKYKNLTKPNKTYKYEFDPIKDGVKRGDLICFTKDGVKERGYRNEGVYIWDGSKICNLYTEIDDYGSIPPEFKVGKEFPPDYWIKKIAHNDIVWLEDDLYNINNYEIVDNNRIIFYIKEYNYKIMIYHSFNDDYPIKFNKYKLSINNNQIQLITNYTCNYNLFKTIYNISIKDNRINQDEIINYIKNNDTFVEKKNDQHYIKYNNIDYLVELTLIPKTNEQLFEQLHGWLINEKPYLEYDISTNLFTKDI